MLFFRSILVSLFILQGIAYGNPLSNKHVTVSAKQPDNLENFGGFTKGADFYFVGKLKKQGDVTIEVTVSLKDPKNCKLISPNPNPVKKTFAGGFISNYTVQKKVGGEQKVTGKIYLVVLKVKEVSFSGESYADLKTDDLAKTYSAPHWTDPNLNGNNDDDGEDRDPVTFKTVTTPTLAAKFYLKGGEDLSYKVKNETTNKEAMLSTLTGAKVEGDLVLKPTKVDTKWSKKITYYNRRSAEKVVAYEITWSVEVEGRYTLEVGKTKHQVYITLADTSAFPQRQESIYYIASRFGHGTADKDKALGKIWNHFKGLKVSRIDPATDVGSKDPKGMKYWGATAEKDAKNRVAAGPFNTDYLLLNADGACGAWAKFFGDLQKTNGIVQATQNIKMNNGEAKSDKSVKVKAVGFFVGKFKRSPDNQIDIKKPTKELSGQGLNKPRVNRFKPSGHCVYKYKNVIYDPSYGKKYKTALQWAKASVGIVSYDAVTNGAVLDVNFLYPNESNGNVNYPNDAFSF